MNSMFMLSVWSLHFDKFPTVGAVIFPGLLVPKYMFIKTVFVSDLAVALFTGKVLVFRVHVQHVTI